MGAPYNNQNNKKEITWKVNQNWCWVCTSHITKEKCTDKNWTHI